MTFTGEFGGSPAFMSPEQVLAFRDCGPPADVYSLAATIYYMLCGCYAKDFSQGRDPLLVVLQNSVVSLRQRDPSLPVPPAGVIGQALVRTESGGFTTATEFLRALESVL